MGPIKIRPEEAVTELTRMGERLAASARVLRQLDEVEYGATQKEEIYREDKVVLYRYKGEKAPTAKVPLLIV